jgi:hypothetical protein
MLTDEKLLEVVNSRKPSTAEGRLATKYPVLVKPSKYKICLECNKREVIDIAGPFCAVCSRKKIINTLPEDEKTKHFMTVIPKRYINASLTYLPKAITVSLETELDTGVLLWGSAGVGKTYAMSAMAKHFMAEGYDVNRIHYETLCLQLRDTFNKQATQTEWTIIEPLLNCDILVIEDVGTSKSVGIQESDFSLRTFLLLLDIRLEHCRPTYITSNKSVENLAKSFDERIGDRLRTFLVIRMEGKSKRNELQ